jgi:hypothetical protein
MAQLFRPAADTIARVVLACTLILPFVAIGAAYALMRSSIAPWHRGHSIATITLLRIMPAIPRPGRDGLSRMGAKAESIRSVTVATCESN